MTLAVVLGLDEYVSSHCNGLLRKKNWLFSCQLHCFMAVAVHHWEMSIHWGCWYISAFTIL